MIPTILSVKSMKRAELIVHGFRIAVFRVTVAMEKGPTIFPINKRVYTPNDRISRSGKEVAGWPLAADGNFVRSCLGKYRGRNICALVSLPPRGSYGVDRQ